VTFAAGMASEGLKPVVAIYSTFLQRAYDQLLHDVCLENLPVTFALDRGGIVGEDGPTHHGLFDFSYLRALPNMVVMAPKDENEMRRMLMTAVNYPGPIAFRYPRGPGIGVELEDPITPIPIGRGEVLTNGEDLLILAIGVTVSEAVSAQKTLKETYGLKATVVNCRFLKPIDTELLCDLVSKIPNILTVEENVCEGGFGSAVLEALHDAGVEGIRVKRLGIRNTFVEHGAREVLRAKYGIDAKGIVRAVVSWFSLKSFQTGS
jgi:1-deoxy-D-xylulose-5-phosphate synthase